MERLPGRTLADVFAAGPVPAQQVRALFNSFEAWDGDEDISGALAIVVHTAYHLGEIRSGLCSVKGNRDKGA